MSETTTHHLLREHLDVDLVVDAAVRLEYQVSGCLHKLVGAIAQEEIAEQYLDSEAKEYSHAYRKSDFLLCLVNNKVVVL